MATTAVPLNHGRRWTGKLRLSEEVQGSAEVYGDVLIDAHLHLMLAKSAHNSTTGIEKCRYIHGEISSSVEILLISDSGPCHLKLHGIHVLHDKEIGSPWEW